jgi:sugar/nucleoside kinase (ribokinase family)
VSILVVGSVALDSVTTPFGKRKEILGGSATFFSISASLFSKVDIVATVGDDFPKKYISLLEKRGIGIKGLEVRKGGKTFRWSGRYGNDLNTAHTLSTHLNVFKDFRADVPPKLRKPKVLFLANIDPSLQARVLKQVERPALVACDSMNYWIENKRGELDKLLGNIDIMLLNESEAKLLSQESNLIKAAGVIVSRGPKAVVIKKGEHGVLYFSRRSRFIAPAYPLEDVYDPTGAGDTFAGGMIGFLAESGVRNEEAIRRAVVTGSIMASFAIEDFSVNRLLEVSVSDVNKRYRDFKDMTRF